MALEEDTRAPWKRLESARHPTGDAVNDPKRLSVEFMGLRNLLLVVTMDCAQPFLKYVDFPAASPGVRDVASNFVKNHAFPYLADAPFELEFEEVRELASTTWSGLLAEVSDPRSLVNTLRLFEPSESNTAAVAWWRLLRNLANKDLPGPSLSERELYTFKSLIRQRIDPGLHEEILGLEKKVTSEWDRWVWRSYVDQFSTDLEGPTIANLIADAVASREVRSVLSDSGLFALRDWPAPLVEWATLTDRRFRHSPAFILDLPSSLLEAKSSFNLEHPTNAPLSFDEADENQ